MMNEYVFAGWLELFFNSSLAVLRSVCTGKDREKDCFPGSSWPASSCAVLLYPWRQSSQLWYISQQAGLTAVMLTLPSPYSRQTTSIRLLPELRALRLGSPRVPGWQVVCSTQGGEICLCFQVLQPFSIPDPLQSFTFHLSRERG